MKLSVKKVQEIIKLAEPLYQESNWLIVDEDEDGLTDTLEALSDTEKERKVLYDYIENLPKDERYELIALTWLGRSDADENPSDWESLVSEANGYTAENAANYLISKSPLAKYLRDGMRKKGMN